MTQFSITTKLAVAGAVGLILACVTPWVRATTASPGTTTPSVPGPWLPSQLMTPDALAKELATPKGRKPVIVCVGFHALYQAAHIPGSLHDGPAREASEIAKLTRWAKSIPKDTPVVIYCGCCPFSRCPNIRPAFEALRSAGLTHLRVLYIENDFARDWVKKGYPAQ